MERTPIVVEFPLRGEWVAYHTPAERVPSHGTDQLGQRYAYFVRDLAVVLKNAFTFDPAGANGLASVLGNHVILKMQGSEVYALIAHARTGSVRVREGDAIQIGQHLADVGHSGNSTAPHLHFHLMDGPDILAARGLPCSFREYEGLRDGTWSTVHAGMPGKREFVRVQASSP